MNKINSLVDWEKPQKTDFLQYYKGVVLLCSGGADSTALLADFIDFFKLKKNVNFFVFHVNFGLRGSESDGDEAFLKSFCDSHQIKFTCYRASKEDISLQSGKSTQEWAREIRYRQVQAFINQGYCIALAHNLDDVAENTLMRMSRGTSLSALAGMKAWSPPYWRPLLNKKKSEILDYLKRKKLPFREDSSNAKIDYSRNKIRHQVLPILEDLHPNASKRIARIAKEAQDMSAYLRSTFSYERNEEGCRTTALDQIQGFNDTVLKEYIVFFTSIEQGQHRTYSHKSLMNIIRQVRSGENWSTQLPGGGILEINRKLLIFRPDVKRVSKEFQKHKKSFAPLEKKIGLSPGTKITQKIPETHVFLIIENISSESYGLTLKQKETKRPGPKGEAWKELRFCTEDHANIQLGKLEYQCMMGEQEILVLNSEGVAYNSTSITIKNINGSNIHAIIR